MHWRDVTKVGIKPHMQLTELIPYRTLSEIGTWHGVDGLLTLRFLKVGEGTRLTAEGRVIGRGPFAVAAAVAGRWAPGHHQGRPRAGQRPSWRGVDVKTTMLGRCWPWGWSPSGCVWTFQGLGYLEGSAMTGVETWAVIGPAWLGSGSAAARSVLTRGDCGPHDQRLHDLDT